MNDNFFDQTFSNKTDRELHDMIYSGLYTDQGFINTALEELRYRRAIKSLDNYTGFLNEEIMNLLKREHIFPLEVSRKIRYEAVKRNLVAPGQYIDDLQQSLRSAEPEKKVPAQRTNLIYPEIKEQPVRITDKRREYKPPLPPPPAPSAVQQPLKTPQPNHNRKDVPTKKAPGRYYSNYWLLKMGKYLLILAGVVLLFLIIDVLKPNLKTNLFKPSDSTFIERIEKPLKSLGNKFGLNTGQITPVQAENLLREKYKFDILAFPVFDGTNSNEITRSKYEKLQSTGLIIYSVCSDAGISGYCATLTGKGNQYAVSEVYKDELDGKNYINVRSNIIEVGKVIDIKRSTQFNGYEVEFTLTKLATPFGIIWSGLKTTTQTKTELFEKHGEVWRLKDAM